MTAAVKDTTFMGGTIAGGASYPGTGFVWGLYTVTKADAADWIQMSNHFTKVLGAFATNDGTGALDPGVISSNTLFTLSVGTGATTVLVIGTPKTE